MVFRTANMNLALKLKIFFFYRYVGQDEFGNKYYEQKKSDVQKSKRMVRYNGLPEASKIPGKYHGWLHHYSEKFPSDNEKKHEWQKKHLPNLTGTKYAYSPKNVSERGYPCDDPLPCSSPFVWRALCKGVPKGT